MRLGEPRRVAVVGGGWAGLAAAVAATQKGARVTLYEAARTLGGRARSIVLPTASGGGEPLRVDNGQHILIGAYTATLRLLGLLGVDVQASFHREPLQLVFPDGRGIVLPDWPSPLDLGWGVLSARGWSWTNRLALMRCASGWMRSGFRCSDSATVADLCHSLTPTLMDDFLEPLCVSALNTPAGQASGTVFLRVLHDAMFAARGGSNLLLPRVDLDRLLPSPAARWLQDQGARLQLGTRVVSVTSAPSSARVDGERFDHVVLALPATQAVRVLADASFNDADGLMIGHWSSLTQALEHNTIATTYAWRRSTDGRENDRPASCAMVALHSRSDAPAQFVFDRGRLGGPPGLLAFVVSANQHDREDLQQLIRRQALEQLGVDVEIIQTVVEKQATFACRPGLNRPPTEITQNISAAGDYCRGPYPATLEGAIRSGWTAGLRAAGHPPLDPDHRT